MSIVSALDSSGVIQKGMGGFVIVYFIINLNKGIYVTKFGQDNCMQSFTYYIWRRTSYPCEHFFLIFEKFPAWNWEALSHLYTQPPFFAFRTTKYCVKGNCDSSECFMEDDFRDLR